MYNDDGKDPHSLANSTYETLTFTATQQGKKLSFDLRQKGRFTGMPNIRELSLVIHNVKYPPAQIKVNNKLVAIVESLEQKNNPPLYAWYDVKNQQLIINTLWRELVNIEVN